MSVERALRDRGRHDDARAALETLFKVRAPAAALLAAATAHAAKLPESHADRACAAVCFAVADAEGAAWAPFCAEVVARAPPHGAKPGQMEIKVRVEVLLAVGILLVRITKPS